MAYGQDVKLHAKALWLTGAGTDAQIAQRLGIQRPETVAEWRRAEGWDQERQYVQKVTEERITQAVAETLSEANLRHLREYQLLQTKGVQALKELSPRTAAEALSMVDVGIKGERLVRGEPTEIRAVRQLMVANIQVLELVVADVLKVLIDSGQLDQRAARKFADEFAKQINAAPFQFTVEG